MTESTFDQEKSEQFIGRLLAIMNNASTAILLSVGNRTGLFTTLASQGTTTSEALAAQTSLQERYVREWLGGMVVSKIVDYSPRDQTYRLPAEHATWLGDQAGAMNVAPVFEFMPVLAGVESGIVRCFHEGGGLDYDQYERFHHVLSHSSRSAQKQNFIDHRLTLIPGIIEQLEAGINVADIGCGQGYVLQILAEAFPKSHFTGFDFVPENVAVANEEARAKGLQNITFVTQDVAQLALTSQFDFIMAIDAIHDQAKPQTVLNGIHTALKPGGHFLMVEINASTHLENNIDHPSGPFLYTVSLMHCMSVSLAHDGPGLGAVWGKELASSMLSEAGFIDLDIHNMPGENVNAYFVARKAEGS